jgi:hypothetical protein
VLIGRVVSSTEFDARQAFIVKDQDEMTIALDLAVIPSAKEFREAIRSLSAEQQEFTSAVRSMQLGGNVFGIMIVQIKPQLERLLHLLPGSLTKEIALCRDLMEMFVELQVPSDLLTYEGPEAGDAAVRINATKSYVAGIKDMVQETKKIEVEEQKMRNRVNYVGVQDASEASIMGSVSAGMMMNSEPMAFHKSSTHRHFSSPASSESDAQAVEAESPHANPTLYKEVNTPVPEVSILQADYSSIPAMLEHAHDSQDPISALRSVIITALDGWRLRSKQGFLHPVKETVLFTDDIKRARVAAFDLLDALSRSGTLIIDGAELHIVYAASHAFDRTLMDTLVQENMNPISRVERSMLIMASLLHDTPVTNIVEATELSRLQLVSSSLFTNVSTQMN